MGFPWWAMLGLAMVMAVVVAMNLRFFKAVWHKVRSGRADLDDDWDPFR